mmetsp:Transcript_28506/g.65873  ORF Transcript_28506/g.65873 Transcript_28506/m.65873 type:complete len:214 (-) Transcript_28506:238-879(-)
MPINACKTGGTCGASRIGRTTAGENEAALASCGGRPSPPTASAGASASSSARLFLNIPCGMDCTMRGSVGADSSKWTNVFRTWRLLLTSRAAASVASATCAQFPAGQGLLVLDAEEAVVEWVGLPGFSHQCTPCLLSTSVFNWGGMDRKMIGSASSASASLQIHPSMNVFLTRTDGCCSASPMLLAVSELTLAHWLLPAAGLNRCNCLSTPNP